MPKVWRLKVYANKWVPAITLNVGDIFAFHPKSEQRFIIADKLRPEYRIKYFQLGCTELEPGFTHGGYIVYPIKAMTKGETIDEILHELGLR